MSLGLRVGTDQMIHRGEGWEIRVGPWEDSPPAEVDVCITDPPFDASTHAGHELEIRNRAEVAFAPVDPLVVAPMLLAHTRRWVVAFCSFAQLGQYQTAAGGMRKDGGNYVRDGAWKKTNPAPQMSGDRPATWGEAIAIMHPRARAMQWNGGGHAALWEAAPARGKERLSQTPKPVALMRMLVEAFTLPGEIVWDPYAGSATTGVACLELGRRFIGQEKNAELADLAARRLSGIDVQPLAPPPNPQTSIFARAEDTQAKEHTRHE